MLINTVYNEFISDKDHLHMNSSKWRSLTEFSQYLGKEGYCIVDETPKGWYIQWIDRDPETLKRAERVKRLEAAKQDEEDRACKHAIGMVVWTAAGGGMPAATAGV